MQGVGCGMCRGGRPEEFPGGSRIFAGEVCDAYLQREDWVRGYTVAIWRGRHVSELHDLTADEIGRYMSEVSRVGRAIADHFAAAKLNYEILGNRVPHVHTHIVPRYLDDPAPGRPLSFPDARRPPQPEERFQRDVASLRHLLGASGTAGETLVVTRTSERTHALGAACVIVDGSGSVLLVKHTYGRLNWELPGGISEVGESAEQTALREAREELGVAVVLEGLSGVYWEPTWRGVGGHHFAFLSRIGDGATPRAADAHEIADLRWCAPDDLPRPISDFTVQRITDALTGGRAVIRTIGLRTWLE